MIRTSSSSSFVRLVIGLAVLACQIMGGGTERGLLMDHVLQALIIATSTYVIVTLWDRSVSTAGLALFGAIALLGCIQIMPLPCEWLESLRPQPYMPAIGSCSTTTISLSSYRTISGLISCLTMIVLFLALSKFDESELGLLGRFVVAGVLVNLALSFVTFSQSDMSWMSDLLGYQAELGAFQNENHYSVYVAVGILAALTMRPQGYMRVWNLLLVTLVLLFLLAAGSRAGVLIGLFVSLLAFVMIARGSRSAVILAPGLGLVAAAYLYGLWIKFTEVEGDQILDRRDYALTTWDAIRDQWPLGTGFSTFDIVYPRYEKLEQVYSAFVNHAHNDFLELILEGGLAGTLILAGCLAAIVMRFNRVRHRDSARTAFIAILIILVHSTVDYPLRTMGIASLFAFFAALLFARAPGSSAVPGRAIGVAPPRLIEAVQAATPTSEGDQIAR
ncbi:O-antigen ligase family protein [Rhizobium sp. AG855]|uniref:O-antigen ligase family protein n=1 Tax=Rhizobium sp. AG855 TaxID=2183898 RepID=UPI000E74089D|nr:O-antigen ligase family protein [Rhizobium sp. AG855]RKE79237.1 O-antigen ligase [Rhizobium sp. AG855]